MGKISFDFTGEVAVITGAATGIGRCTAVSFAEAGAKVAVCDFNEEKAGETVQMCKELGATAKFYKMDVTSSAQEIAEIRDQIVHDFGRIDILHSNAGIAQKETGSIYSIDDDAWERLYKVNVFGTVKVCRTFAEVMKEQKSGKMILTASVSGYAPSPTMPAYSSSKIAVINIMQSLAKELGDYNINVNVLNPGFVYTPIYSEGGALAILRGNKALQAAGLTEPEDVVNAMARSSALHRMQQPIDMAYTVLFLASEGAREITGQAINVDSGYCIR